MRRMIERKARTRRTRRGLHAVVVVFGPACLLLAAAASAQPAGPAPAPRLFASTPAAASASAVRPASGVQVVEDDQVRIEETRVRGQLRRVTVAPKGSALQPYEINVGAGGRDPSQDKSSAGQRVWSVLRF